MASGNEAGSKDGALTPFERAHRFVGVKELAGSRDHPLIQWWMSLCGYDLESHDEIPWCSGFVNGVMWDLRLPMSNSAAARSWLKVGEPVDLGDARLGDVVVLKRGYGPQPGPEVIRAQGHVGFFAGWASPNPGTQPGPRDLLILGGNQNDSVSVATFPRERVLSIRRIV